MSGGFYVGSGQRGFEIAARIWAAVMAASLIAGWAFPGFVDTRFMLLG